MAAVKVQGVLGNEEGDVPCRLSGRVRARSRSTEQSPDEEGSGKRRACPPLRQDSIRTPARHDEPQLAPLTATSAHIKHGPLHHPPPALLLLPSHPLLPPAHRLPILLAPRHLATPAAADDADLLRAVQPLFALPPPREILLALWPTSASRLHHQRQRTPPLLARLCLPRHRETAPLKQRRTRRTLRLPLLPRALDHPPEQQSLADVLSELLGPPLAFDDAPPPQPEQQQRPVRRWAPSQRQPPTQCVIRTCPYFVSLCELY